MLQIFLIDFPRLTGNTLFWKLSEKCKKVLLPSDVVVLLLQEQFWNMSWIILKAISRIISLAYYR